MVAAVPVVATVAEYPQEQGGTDFNAPPYNAPPGYGGRIAAPGELPDPGGYWEYPNFGGPAIWHSTNGGGAPNMDTFNPGYGNSAPGGGLPGGGDGEVPEPQEGGHNPMSGWFSRG